jgi:hypothetical protein
MGRREPGDAAQRPEQIKAGAGGAVGARVILPAPEEQQQGDTHRRNEQEGESRMAPERPPDIGDCGRLHSGEGGIRTLERAISPLLA